MKLNNKPELADNKIVTNTSQPTTPNDDFIIRVSKESSSDKVYKCIPDPAVARKLLHSGNAVCDFKPLHKEEDIGKKPSNFVFELTDKLMSDYKKITGQDLIVRHNN